MYDLVIIGGGAAGLFAAWTALEKGIKNIVLLENLKNTGGNSAMAGAMIYAVNTPYIAPGLNDLEAEYSEALYFHHYDFIEPALIRNWLSESANTIKWLEDKGYEMRLCELGEGYTHIMADSPGVSWFHHVLRPLTKEITERGVELRTQVTALSIEKDITGRVRGVAVRNADGTTGTVEGKNVLLACGGFMSDKELLHKYFPSYYTEDSFYQIVPSPANGIDLAKSAGAKLNAECTLVKESGMCFTPGPRSPGRIFAMDGSVYINKFGRRFVNESLWNHNYCANALLRQPDREVYTIYSSETLESVMDSVLPFDFRSNREVYMDFLREAADEGRECRFFDTLDEMAGWIGAEPAVLKETISNYNRYCEEGYDPEQTKPARYLKPLLSGPYLAIKVKPMYIDTIGPVVVDGDLHVLGEDSRPIPGFYAAGVIAAGWEGRDYMRFGSALSFSSTSGRLAGMSIARDMGI